MKRLPTGHDPTSVAVSPDSRWAYVANRLDDPLTVMDLGNEGCVPSIWAAPRNHPDSPRRTAVPRRQLLLSGQFACATCHPNTHLDGLAWNLETPQLGRDRVDNRTLRGIKDTAPFKWNGRNPDLQTQCGPRIATFLFRSEGFNPRELEDLVAYINSIPLPPTATWRPTGNSPTRRNAAKPSSSARPPTTAE